MLAVEGLHPPAHLIAVPDVAALELGQQDLVAADLIQQVLDRLDFVHPALSRQVLAVVSRSRHSTARRRLSARWTATWGRQRSVAYSINRDV